MTKRNEETQTAFALRSIVNETIERCALVAESNGKYLGEPAVGGCIADEIRRLKS